MLKKNTENEVLKLSDISLFLLTNKSKQLTVLEDFRDCVGSPYSYRFRQTL